MITSTAFSSLPSAFRQAIESTRNSVQGPNEFLVGARDNIERWKALDLPVGTSANFIARYDEIITPLPDEERDALAFYLSIHSHTIASHILLWQPQREHQFAAVQALAGAALMLSLTVRDEELSARQDALQNVTQNLRRDFKIDDLIQKIADLSPRPIISDQPHEQVVQYVDEAIARARETLATKPNTPLIRLMAALYDEVAAFCQKEGLPNHLKNVSIGDIDPRSLPAELAEKMGLNPTGPKALAIMARAQAYLQMQQTGGRLPYRYDLSALGSPALREHFLRYASHFGLYSPKTPAVATMISAGGSPGLNKSLLVARRYLEEQGVRNPSVHFGNPALRMITVNARELGFTVLEPEAVAENRYFEDPNTLDNYLGEHPECRIFIFTPMNNPSGAMADPQKTRELLEVLRKHKMVLINDFAYLGTGDLERNREIGEILSTYEMRIDVIAMTKFFATPALRCGSLLTPHEGLGSHFKSLAQANQPSESYTMQAEALARWELVTNEDRFELAKLYQKRQQALIEYLKRLDDKREAEGLPRLVDRSVTLTGESALYVLVPLVAGTDPFDFVKATGLVGTPATGFFATGGERPLIRLAVGITAVETM